jgi:hypothetical protein
MNLLSWLLFGLVLGVIALSSSKKSTFTAVCIGINSIFFGVVLAHTIMTRGLFAVNILPFIIALVSIGGFISLQRVLRLL